ncbi:hypothetical protein EG68_11870 [Paragonimus skrjabini miyazakii]|uniref:Uncharacterized protein n=1 Tax=Paragonimus skrjabini miyazakii TaxID=59628 RepID=A0A8S9YF88_9TREM|nr:hypothetical protein EG68_11870 [Paragonimus skrjabini miyazakii]
MLFGQLNPDVKYLNIRCDFLVWLVERLLCLGLPLFRCFGTI